MLFVDWSVVNSKRRSVTTGSCPIYGEAGIAYAQRQPHLISMDGATTKRKPVDNRASSSIQWHNVDERTAERERDGTDTEWMTMLIIDVGENYTHFWRGVDVYIVIFLISHAALPSAHLPLSTSTTLSSSFARKFFSFTLFLSRSLAVQILCKIRQKLKLNWTIFVCLRCPSWMSEASQGNAAQNINFWLFFLSSSFGRVSVCVRCAKLELRKFHLRCEIVCINIARDTIWWWSSSMSVAKVVNKRNE